MADVRTQQAEDGFGRPMPTVKALCSRCFYWEMSDDDRQYEMQMAMLVSPRGVVHHNDGSEMTLCGKDATDWWWRA